MWCTPGGEGPHVTVLPEQKYFMLEGQLEVDIANEQGGGANYLCLPLSNIGNDGPLHSFSENNVPCPVCYTSARETVFMIPAQITCPSSWTQE